MPLKKELWDQYRCDRCCPVAQPQRIFLIAHRQVRSALGASCVAGSHRELPILLRTSLHCRVALKVVVTAEAAGTIEEPPPPSDSERRVLEALVQDVLENGPPSECAPQPPSDGGPSLRLYPIVQEFNISSSHFQKRCGAIQPTDRTNTPCCSEPSWSVFWVLKHSAVFLFLSRCPDRCWNGPIWACLA